MCDKNIVIYILSLIILIFSLLYILQELSELRRKVNDLIEIKRRLEEETGALRFSLDNVRTKMEAEIREK